MQFLSKQFITSLLFMRSHRVNKAAILQRNQYLNPKARYIPLIDKSKVASLARANGYILRSDLVVSTAFSSSDTQVPQYRDFFLQATDILSFNNVLKVITMLTSIEVSCISNGQLQLFYSYNGSDWTHLKTFTISSVVPTIVSFSINNNDSITISVNGNPDYSDTIPNLAIAPGNIFKFSNNSGNPYNLNLDVTHRGITFT